MRSKEAVRKAVKKYDEKFTIIRVRIPNEEIDTIREYASANGESVSGLVRRLLKEEISGHSD